MPALRTTAALRGLAVAATLLACGAAQAQLRYRIESLGVLAPDDATSYSEARALNDRGAVVGFSHAVSDAQPFRAFIHENGRMRALGSLGTLTAAMASDINDRGQVVGYATDREGTGQRPFLLDRGALRDLDPDPAPGRIGQAEAINDAGQVGGSLMGRAFTHDGTQPRFAPLGSDTGFSSITALNDRGVAVGRADVAGGSQVRPFVWDGTGLSWLPDPADTHDCCIVASDINDAGQIGVNGNARAYLYGNGAYQDLGSLRGQDSYVNALNDQGWAVGVSGVGADPRFPYHAYLYRDGRMHDLNDLLDTTAARRWVLHAAHDINERGQIVGTGMVDGQVRTYLATPVPEPGTWALLLAGTVGLGAWCRRRRRRRQAGAVPTVAH